VAGWSWIDVWLKQGLSLITCHPGRHSWKGRAPSSYDCSIVADSFDIHLHCTRLHCRSCTPLLIATSPIMAASN